LSSKKIAPSPVGRPLLRPYEVEVEKLRLAPEREESDGSSPAAWNPSGPKHALEETLPVEPAIAKAMSQRAQGVYATRDPRPKELRFALTPDVPTPLRNLPRASVMALGWPAPPTMEGALAMLASTGFQEIESTGDVRVLAKQGAHLTLVPFALNEHMHDAASHLRGYAIHSSEGVRAQLGDVAIDMAQWALLEEGYYSQTSIYENLFLPRPTMQRRSMSPLGSSEVHGPHDAIKQLLRGALVGPALRQAIGNRRELAELSGRAQTLLAQLKGTGGAPRQFAVMVEGTDGASKSGNGQSIVRALERAGYVPRVQNFRRPTAQEAALGIEGRYHQFVAQAGEGQTVSLLDRGIPGDYVHAGASLQEVVAAARLLDTAWQEQGVSVMKLLFCPGTEAPIETFGKRVARAQIANDLLSSARQDLGERERRKLTEAANFGPGLNDFRSIERAEVVNQRYREFAEASSDIVPWHIIDTSSRHAGRVEAMRRFVGHLEGLL
jgi:hypothetical protein